MNRRAPTVCQAPREALMMQTRVSNGRGGQSWGDGQAQGLPVHRDPEGER